MELAKKEAQDKVAEKFMLSEEEAEAYIENIGKGSYENLGMRKRMAEVILFLNLLL